MLGTISIGHQGASWEDHSLGGYSVQIKGGPSIEGTSPGSRPVSVLLLFSPSPATSQVQSRASPQVEPGRPAALGSSASLGESRERSSLRCSPEQLETKHEVLRSVPRVSRRLLGGRWYSQSDRQESGLLAPTMALDWELLLDSLSVESDRECLLSFLCLCPHS